MSAIPFSEESQNILRYAHQLAQEFGHAVLYPEHVLLSISAYRGYGVNQFFEALHVNQERLGEQCQLSIAKQVAFVQATSEKGVVLSPDIQTMLEQARKTALSDDQTFINTVHLLFGLLAPGLQSAALLHEHGVSVEQINALLGTLDIPAEAASAPRIVEKPRPVQKYRFQISPTFLLILAVTIVAGAGAFYEWFTPGLSVFLFVTGGWVISLCLHEFGHAAMAYWAGDDSVIDKGYLTLDPFKYTHGLMSIVFPVIIVMMGGIGLPGGAVYIDRSRIRHTYQHSLVSAAGPFANIIFSIVLAIPFVLGFHRMGHATFWAGMAMLAVLQVTAIVLNLLPLPGLDGFGILAPYLPEDILRLAYSFSQLTFFLIFFLFFYSESFQRWFWGIVFQITMFVNIDPFLFITGYEFFRFWN